MPPVLCMLMSRIGPQAIRRPARFVLPWRGLAVLEHLLSRARINVLGAQRALPAPLPGELVLVVDVAFVLHGSQDGSRRPTLVSPMSSDGGVELLVDADNSLPLTRRFSTRHRSTDPEHLVSEYASSAASSPASASLSPKRTTSCSTSTRPRARALALRRGAQGLPEGVWRYPAALLTEAQPGCATPGWQGQPRRRRPLGRAAYRSWPAARRVGERAPHTAHRRT
jgi:hypothetical protein